MIQFCLREDNLNFMQHQTSTISTTRTDRIIADKTGGEMNETLQLLLTHFKNVENYDPLTADIPPQTDIFPHCLLVCLHSMISFAISLNPEIPSIWNLKKKLILIEFFEAVGAMGELKGSPNTCTYTVGDLKREVQDRFVADLQQNENTLISCGAKTYAVWAHRLWLIRNLVLVSIFLSEESEIEKIPVHSERGEQILVESGGRRIKAESAEIVASKFSNLAASNFLLSNQFPPSDTSPLSLPIPSDLVGILERERGLCEKLFCVDERNFHCWNYHQILGEILCLLYKDGHTHVKIRGTIDTTSFCGSSCLAGEFENNMGKYYANRVENKASIDSPSFPTSNYQLPFITDLKANRLMALSVESERELDGTEKTGENAEIGISLRKGEAFLSTPSRIKAVLVCLGDNCMEWKLAILRRIYIPNFPSTHMIQIALPKNLPHRDSSSDQPQTNTTTLQPVQLQTNRVQKILTQNWQLTHEAVLKSFSNYSAWHVRTQLPYAFATTSQELELIRQGIYTEPADQSVWQYYWWLLFRRLNDEMEAEIEAELEAEKSSQPVERLVAHFSFPPPKLSKWVEFYRSELKQSEELDAVEPDCKYNLLSKLKLWSKIKSLTGQVAPEAEKVQRKLCEIDPQRAGYYFSLLVALKR